MSAAPLTVVYMGNSITGSLPPGGTTTPGEQAAVLLSTRLGATITAQVAPWHGIPSSNGAQTTDDLPSDPRGSGNFTAALALAGSPAILSLMLGTNDARYTSNSAALFGTNLQAICTGWRTNTGGIVILHYDPAFVVPTQGTATQLTLLQSYQAEYDAVVAANPDYVFAGDKTAFDIFTANPGWLYDGVHPDAANGVPAIAAAWAAAEAPILARALTYSPPVPVGMFFS